METPFAIRENRRRRGGFERRDRIGKQTVSYQVRGTFTSLRLPTLASSPPNSFTMNRLRRARFLLKDDRRDVSAVSRNLSRRTLLACAAGDRPRTLGDRRRQDAVALFLAPLAGYTGLPFRRTVRELGGLGLATTDLVNACALIERRRARSEPSATTPDD